METQEDIKWFIINELERFSSVLCSHWIDNQQSTWLVEQYKKEILRIFSNFSTDNNLGNNSTGICSTIDSMFIGLVKDTKNILVEKKFETKHMRQIFQELHYTLADIRTDFKKKFIFPFDKNKIKTPRHTTDNFDEHLKKIEYLKGFFSGIVRKYGYERIQTPTIEHTDIFKLTSIFAEDKSYVFKDKSDRELVLRPDINAPLSRVVVNNKDALWDLPYKMFFTDKVYRYRHGNNREFELFGIETYGLKSNRADAELIHMLNLFVQEFWITDSYIEYNNINFIKTVITEICNNRGIEINVDALLYQIRLQKWVAEIVSLLEIYSFESEDVQMIIDIIHCWNDDKRSRNYITDIVKKIPQLENIKNEFDDFEKYLNEYNIKDVRLCLGKLHGTWFYSWLTYQFFTGPGEELWDWWRYDNMVDALGWWKISWTGIWFWLERFIRLIEKRKGNINIENNKKKICVSLHMSDMNILCYREVMKWLMKETDIVVNETNIEKLWKLLSLWRSKQYSEAIQILENNEGKFKLILIHLKEDMREEKLFNDMQELGDFLLQFTGVT